MKEEALISVKDLSIGYFHKRIFNSLYDNLSFSAKAGDLICFLGPNGTGKSTLLKTISGFLPYNKGDIYIKNIPLEEYPSKDLSKIVSVVLTEKVSVDNMTVFDLVSMGRYPYTNFWGKLNEQDKKVIDESIDLCGITNIRNKSIYNISDGELQKTMIAKALSQNTECIILDEPTAFLDFPSKIEILYILRKLAVNENKLIILSTHDLELALQMSDILWLLNRREGFVSGLSEDLILNGEINRFFDKKDILFNTSLGKFEFFRNLKYTIYTTDSVSDTLWLKNALRKRNINLEYKKGFPCIKNEDGAFYLYESSLNEKIVFYSISELLQCISCNIDSLFR
ncbi:MAG: ABC transporter ATP-binding protein [Hyphomicrobiales bacterium]